MYFGTVTQQGFKSGDRIRIVESKYNSGSPLRKGFETTVLEGGLIESPTGSTTTGCCAKWELAYKTWGEMSDEEKGALLLAHHEGKTVEWSSTGRTWLTCPRAVGRYESYYYRVKPEPVKEVRKIYGKLGHGSFSENKQWSDTHCISYEVIDGEVDKTSIKMEEI